MACKKLASLPSSCLWLRFSFWWTAACAFRVQFLLAIDCRGSINFTWDFRGSRRQVCRELRSYYWFLLWWSRNRNCCLCSSDGRQRFIEARCFRLSERCGITKNKVCSQGMNFGKLRFFWVPRLWCRRRYVCRWPAWLLRCNRCSASAPKHWGLLWVHQCSLFRSTLIWWLCRETRPLFRHRLWVIDWNICCLCFSGRGWEGFFWGHRPSKIQGLKNGISICPY